MELGARVANDPAPPLREFRPDVPQGLEAAVLKCMEKDPNRRFPNIGELALALRPFGPRRSKALVERISGIIQASGLSQSALAIPPSPASPVLPPSTEAARGDAPVITGAALGRTVGPPMTSARTVAAVVGGVLVLGVAAAVFVNRQGPAKLDSAAGTTAPAVSEVPKPAPMPTPVVQVPEPSTTLAAEPTAVPVANSSARVPSQRAVPPGPAIGRSAPAHSAPVPSPSPAEPSDPLQRLTPKR
jgi:serine/threonine-protein kinase